MNHRRIKVAIVEQKESPRPSVRACIAADSAFEIGTCGTLSQVLSTFTRTLPDIIVLDTLDATAQHEALASLATVANDIPTLVLTLPGSESVHPSDDRVIETMNREQSEDKNDVYKFHTMLLIRLKNLGFRRPFSHPLTTHAPYESNTRGDSHDTTHRAAKKSGISSPATERAKTRGPYATATPTRGTSHPNAKTRGPYATATPTRCEIRQAGIPSTYLIAIGASLGGVEATKELLCELDPKGLPGIVVVQHMKIGFTADYARQLNLTTPFRVREAKNGDLIEDGLVLIAEGGKQLIIKRQPSGFMAYTRKTATVGGFCPSVDVLFKSVASAAGDHAVGIILTGIGHDGSDGLKQMHDAGSRTWGQSAESCAVYGMPLAAKKLGAVDREADLSGIARGVQQYFREYARVPHNICGTTATQRHTAQRTQISPAAQSHTHSQERTDL